MSEAPIPPFACSRWTTARAGRSSTAVEHWNATEVCTGWPCLQAAERPHACAPPSIAGQSPCGPAGQSMARDRGRAQARGHLPCGWITASQLSDHFLLNQIKFWGMFQPSYAFVDRASDQRRRRFGVQSNAEGPDSSGRIYRNIAEPAGRRPRLSNSTPSGSSKRTSLSPAQARQAWHAAFSIRPAAWTNGVSKEPGASALLIPANEIREALRGRKIRLEVLAALKPEWKVAMQALLMRVSALGLIEPNQSRYLWQKISSHGWRLREPPELDFPREAPRVLPRIIKSHLNDLGYSGDELANFLRIHKSEFDKFYGGSAPDEPQRPRLRIVE